MEKMYIGKDRLGPSKEEGRGLGCSGYSLNEEVKGQSTKRTGSKKNIARKLEQPGKKRTG